MTSCPILLNSFTTDPARRSAEDSGRLFTKNASGHSLLLEFSLEVPLDIEEYVSLAGVDSLEVGLFHTAVVEVEPGFVVGGKGRVVT